MLRQVLIPSASNPIFVLPEMYYGKKIMLTISAMEEKINNSTYNFAKAKEARTFFNSLQCDMSGFKFNREEANER